MERFVSSFVMDKNGTLQPITLDQAQAIERGKGTVEDEAPDAQTPPPAVSNALKEPQISQRATRAATSTPVQNATSANTTHLSLIVKLKMRNTDKAAPTSPVTMTRATVKRKTSAEEDVDQIPGEAPKQKKLKIIAKGPEETRTARQPSLVVKLNVTTKNSGSASSNNAQGSDTALTASFPNQMMNRPFGIPRLGQGAPASPFMLFKVKLLDPKGPHKPAAAGPIAPAPLQGDPGAMVSVSEDKAKAHGEDALLPSTEDAGASSPVSARSTTKLKANNVPGATPRDKNALGRGFRGGKHERPMISDAVKGPGHGTTGEESSDSDTPLAKRRDAHSRHGLQRKAKTNNKGHDSDPAEFGDVSATPSRFDGRSANKKPSAVPKQVAEQFENQPAEVEEPAAQSAQDPASEVEEAYMGHRAVSPIRRRGKKAEDLAKNWSTLDYPMEPPRFNNGARGAMMGFLLEKAMEDYDIEPEVIAQGAAEHAASSIRRSHRVKWEDKSDKVFGKVLQHPKKEAAKKPAGVEKAKEQQ